MSLPDHYLFNVALHAAGLSVLVLVAILFMRKPQRVSVAALSGLLAIAILPWISAWRTGDKAVEMSEADPVSVSSSALPQWTVIRIPAAQIQEVPVVVKTEKPMVMPGPDAMLAYGWAAGAVVLLVGLSLACLRMLLWRAALKPMDENGWRAICRESGELPSRDCFRISSGAGGPCVAGILRPLIVVPGYLMEQGKERELQWALLHELRHWRGGDSRWTMVLELVRAIHWWNPMVHLLIARWKLTREFICDLSAADDEDRPTYSEFLIAMASREASRNPLAVTMVRKQRLKALRARIVTILEATPGSGTPFEKGVLLSACCGLLGAALLISGVRIGSDLSTLSDSEEVSGVQDNPFGGMAFAEDEPQLELSSGTKVLQVKVSIKAVLTAGKIAENGSIRNDEEMQMLMRELAQTKGTMLMTLPNVTARAGERAAIEIIRENPAKPSWSLDVKDPKERPEGYAGWSYRIGTQVEGKKLKLDVGIGHGFVPGAQFAADHASWERGAKGLFDEDEEIAWDKLVSTRGGAAGDLAPKDTLAIYVGEVMPGQHRTVFVTVTPIDMIGVEVGDFESARYDLPPPVGGNLKIRGTLIEVGDDPKAPFGDGGLSAPPAYCSKETAAKWRKQLKVIKELPEVVVAGGEFHSPWDEVGELSFSAEFVGDRAWTNFRFRALGAPEDAPGGTPTSERMIPSDCAALLYVTPNDRGDSRFMILEVEAADAE